MKKLWLSQGIATAIVFAVLGVSFLGFSGDDAFKAIAIVGVTALIVATAISAVGTFPAAGLATATTAFAVFAAIGAAFGVFICNPMANTPTPTNIIDAIIIGIAVGFAEGAARVIVFFVILGALFALGLALSAVATFAGENGVSKRYVFGSFLIQAAVIYGVAGGAFLGVKSLPAVLPTVGALVLGGLLLAIRRSGSK